MQILCSTFEGGNENSMLCNTLYGVGKTMSCLIHFEEEGKTVCVLKYNVESRTMFNVKHFKNVL
jgi:uncharacterized protein YkuJ